MSGIGMDPGARPGAHSQGLANAYAVYMLVLIVLTNMIAYADRHVFSVLMPAIKAEFGLDDTTMGFIGGPGFILTFVIFSFPLARLADRWSRRAVLAIAMTFWSCATAACGLAANVWQLTAARLAVGMGEAGGLPPSQSLIASLFEKRRNTALGALGATPYLGVLVGLAGGAALAEAWGWRWAFIALAIPGLPLALLIWLTGPRRNAKPAAAVDAEKVSALGTLYTCVRIRSLLLLSFGVGVFNVFGYAGAIWLPSYFMRSHGMSMLEAGSWLGVGSAIGGVAGAFASGAFVEALVKRDDRWQLRVPAIGLILAFPLLAVMFLLPGEASVNVAGQALPLVALFGVCTSFLSSLWMGPCFGAAARLVPPDRRSQAVSMVVIVVNVMGSLLGPPIAGFVSDLLGQRFGDEALRYSLLSMSLLTLIGGATLWAASIHYPREMVRT